MNGYLMLSKKDRDAYDREERKNMENFVKEVVDVLKIFKSFYWLNKINKCKTLSGKYENAKKIDLSRKNFS